MKHLYSIVLITVLLGCAGEQTDTESSSESNSIDTSDSAIGIVYTDEELQKFSYLAEEEEGWVEYDLYGKEVDRLKITLGDSGKYYYGDYVIRGIDSDGLINYAWGDAVGDCFSYRVIDMETIEITFYDQCARSDRSGVFYRASENHGKWQENYGVGVMVMDPTFDGPIELHGLEADDGSAYTDYPTRTIRLNTSSELGEVRYDSDVGEEWGMYSYYPEFEIYHAVIFKQFTEDTYFIEFNEEKWVLDQPAGKFYTWEEYLVDITLSIHPNHTQPNPLYMMPGDEMPLHDLNDEADKYHYKAREINGSWMRLSVFEDEMFEQKKDVDDPWIRWRKDGQILVYIALIY